MRRRKGRALVTGSAGFIGRHVTARLRADGWAVHGVDVKDGVDCRTVFATDCRFDLIVHCAAVVGGRWTIEREPLRVATDLAIDSDFFQFVHRTRPWRAVYFSSSAAYPVALQTGANAVALAESMLDLDDPRLPDVVYGWVKLTGEQVARLVNAERDVVHVFRPFSGYGPGQDLDYPFPSLVDRAMRRADPFDVWGDGAQCRDWVHVDDIVELVMRVLPESPSVVGPVNVCTGRATSFLDLANLVTAAAGYAPLVRTLPDAPTGVRYRVGDPVGMRQFHEAKITVEEGVSRALRTA